MSRLAPEDVSDTLLHIAKKHAEGFTAPEATLQRLIRVVNALASMAGITLAVTDAAGLVDLKHYTPKLIRDMHSGLETFAKTMPGHAHEIFPGVHELLQASRVALSTLDAMDGSKDAHDDEAPPLQVWPKQCPSCKRVLNESAWASLPFAGYVGCVRSAGKRYAVELRHCICVSTIGVQVELPMAVNVGAGPQPVQFAGRCAECRAVLVDGACPSLHVQPVF